MRFSTNLRNLRISRHMTQMDLANGLNTSQSSITAWETEAREPDFKTIRRIADFFDVPISALLPSDDDLDSDYANLVALTLQHNKKLRKLFETAKLLNDTELDAVITICQSMIQKHV